MNKSELLPQIIAQLSHDLDVLFNAAKTAHEAATNSENLPDNKYGHIALEASYVAQGQANRASEVRQAIEVYRQLCLTPMTDEEIRLAALVRIEAKDGTTKVVFIGPSEGGLKVTVDCTEVVVITPGSPLGSQLIGKTNGDTVQIGNGKNQVMYEITEVI